MERGPNDYVGPGAQLEDPNPAGTEESAIKPINVDELKAESYKEGYAAGSVRARTLEAAAAIAEQRDRSRQWIEGQTDARVLIRSARLGLREVLLDDLQVSDAVLPHVQAAYDALDRIRVLLHEGEDAGS